jgi:ferredoxin
MTVRRYEDLTPEEMEIYRKFYEWQKTGWDGVPSGEDYLPLIAIRYTPEEAELLTGMRLYIPQKLSVIAGMKNMDPAALEEKLDACAGKGLVFRDTKNGEPRYYLHDMILSQRMWGAPGPSDEAARQYAILADRMLPTDIKVYVKPPEKPNRVIPIRQTVEDDRTIRPYEDMDQLLASFSYFCEGNCLCRIRINMAGRPHEHESNIKNCLHFDKLAHYMVENGLAREITRQEAADILRDSAERGLILSMTNIQHEPDTICSCCKCCCTWIEGLHKRLHGGSFSASNYRVHLDADLCTGCGLCVKRCQMEAITLIDMPSAKGRKIEVKGKGKDGKERRLVNKTGKVSAVDLAGCVGCGVCSYKCPSKALTMKRNDIEHAPPEKGIDLLTHWLTVNEAP